MRKLDSAGNAVWEQVLSGEGGMYDVLVTQDGKIRVLGEYATELEFAGMKLGHKPRKRQARHRPASARLVDSSADGSERPQAITPIAIDPTA